jgi:hypothetical protein
MVSSKRPLDERASVRTGFSFGGPREGETRGNASPSNVIGQNGMQLNIRLRIVVRIYAKMYEDYDKRFYGFKSISGSMNYSTLIDTLVMAIGDTDTLSLGFGRQGRFEVADAMEKWVKMRTKHLTTILITGRYDTADRRLFDSEQLKMVRNAKKPDDLSDILVDFGDMVGLTFSVE